MPDTGGPYPFLGDTTPPAAQGVYTLRLMLPGITKEHILVAFLDGCVEVHGRGTHEWEEDGPGVRFYQAEELSAYHRIPLPPDADASAAVVRLADGEAVIELPSRRKS